MSESSSGRFGEDAMREALSDLCSRIDLSADNAELLRLTNNAVFLLPDERMVVRIARTSTFFDRVHKVARLAGWFEEIDAPTIRLHPHVPDQPLAAGRSLATAWTYMPPSQPAPTVADLGGTLRAFHRLKLPEFELPTWTPISDVRRRLDDSEGLEPSERTYLTEWSDVLESTINETRDSWHNVLIHGDAHVGNLLPDGTGRVALCDFDATAVGPALVDLAAVAVGDARFGRTQFDDLRRAYGVDPTEHPLWKTVLEARELKMIAAAVPLLESAPGVREEFLVRLDSVRDGDNAQWTPFAELNRNK